MVPQMIGLSDFTGLWRVRRQISDHLGTDGQFIGEVRFTPQNEGLLLTETGTLTIGSTSFSAERRYEWRAEGEGIAVYFDDGRFFHAFTLEGHAAAAHWCDPDQYDVRYDFSRWPEWSATWRVKGPRKDYEMHSHYIR